MSQSAAVNLRPDWAGWDGPGLPPNRSAELLRPVRSTPLASLSGLSKADAKSGLAEYGANVIRPHEEMASGRTWSRPERMS
jgi:hypothetical protein